MRSIAILCTAALAGCGLAQQAQMRDRVATLQAQSNAAAQECQAKFPAGNPKIAVARTECFNRAMVVIRPVVPYPDLLDLQMARNLTVAEQVQNGQMTIAQGNEAIAQKASEITTEVQRRQLANRSVAAQENAAAASLQAPAPRTCIGGPNVVSCF